MGSKVERCRQVEQADPAEGAGQHSEESVVQQVQTWRGPPRGVSVCAGCGISPPPERASAHSGRGRETESETYGHGFLWFMVHIIIISAYSEPVPPPPQYEHDEKATQKRHVTPLTVRAACGLRELSSVVWPSFRAILHSAARPAANPSASPFEYPDSKPPIALSFASSDSSRASNDASTATAPSGGL